jgi:hypothetical protein
MIFPLFNSFLPPVGFSLLGSIFATGRFSLAIGSQATT